MKRERLKAQSLNGAAAEGRRTGGQTCNVTLELVVERESCIHTSANGTAYTLLA